MDSSNYYPSDVDFEKSSIDYYENKIPVTMNLVGD